MEGCRDPPFSPKPAPRAHCTLLQLVTYLTKLGACEQETSDTALALIRSGQIRLTGSFRDRPLWSAPIPDLRN